MPISSTRTLKVDRLFNAAQRFAEISKDNPVKLFCLLYMLDIRHYRETGESCTGESYFAMADGPAPGSLRPLLAMRGLDLRQGISLLTDSPAEGEWRFDPHPYRKNALDIMRELENCYRSCQKRDLCLDDGHAWWRVYNKGVGAVIPYEMTLPPSRSVMVVEKNRSIPIIPSVAQAHQSIAPRLFSQFR